MSLSEPPYQLPTLDSLPDEPQWADFQIQSGFFHAFPAGKDPLWFNPNNEVSPGDITRGGRFHPFRALADALPIPTFYGAADIKAALAETVFHDVWASPPGPPAAVSMKRIAGYEVTKINGLRPARLIDLTGSGAQRLRVRKEQVTWSWPAAYPFTRDCAALFHKKYPDAHGISWTSRQRDPYAAFVLFGDRYSSLDLTVSNGIWTLAPDDERLSSTGGRFGFDAAMEIVRESGWTLTP